MAKFDLATTKNMKVWIFNLSVALRRADFAAKKAASELERLNREGNTRDIDTSEVSNAMLLVADTTNLLQYTQTVMGSIQAENERLSAVKQDFRDAGPDVPANNARVALYDKIDLFYKLAKK